MVPPSSQRIPRVRRYSGYHCLLDRFGYVALTLSGSVSQQILLQSYIASVVLTPRILLLVVWPPPRSLATTCGISVDLFSSSYLDVSVRRVPLVYLCIQYTITYFEYAWFPNSDICGYYGYLRLPAAFRSLSRPSSAPDAKAFPLCSF